MADRIRARPPPTDGDRWAEGRVTSVTHDDTHGRYVVRVETEDGEATVRVTPAIYDLFTGRLERPAETPADVVGATVWVR